MTPELRELYDRWITATDRLAKKLNLSVNEEIEILEQALKDLNEVADENEDCGIDNDAKPR
jgi:hypothetical protein